MQSADEKAIKKVYKKLSLKFHPDKIRPDPSKNETLETLNARYVEISKAYQALTDEEVRNNYIQYGHPDGKQSFSIGIALPQFIISDGNGKYVVLVYTLLLGVLLPYLVGSWWYGTQRMSKEGILMESSNNLFREYNDDIDESGVVAALSTGREFANILKGDKAEAGLAKLESRITAEGFLSPSDQEKLDDIDEPARRKALALLWAYLGRVRPDETAENSHRFEVAPIAQALTQSFLATSLAYGTTGPIMAAYSACQHIIQALPPKAAPLLQLPHFTPAIVKTVEGDLRSHLSIQQFMSLPDARRRGLAVGKGMLSDAQYKTAMQVAGQLPYLRVEKAFFKVTGEKYVTPSSLVSLVVKGRIIPPGSENVPAVNPLDLEDVDAAEDDVEALTGRKKQTIKGPDGELITIDDKPTLPPLTFAPYFYKEIAPRWHVFLTDSKQGKMAVPPFTFTQFDRPIFDDEGRPTFNMQTFKAQFAAPPHPGAYTFVMQLVCDSYVGFDTKMQVTLHVEDASKAEEMESEGEISEPDEGKTPFLPESNAVIT